MLRLERQGGAGHFAGEGGEVGEREDFGGGDERKLLYVDQERMNRDVAVGDGVTGFFEWGDVQQCGAQARKKLLEVSAKLCDGIGMDLDGGEMPHARKKMRDVGLG